MTQTGHELRSARQPRRWQLLVVGGWVAVIVGYQTWALTRGITPKDSVLRIIDVMRGSAWA